MSKSKEGEKYSRGNGGMGVDGRTKAYIYKTNKRSSNCELKRDM